MKGNTIKRIFLYRCPFALKEPFVISLGKLDFADNVIVKIETADGRTGFGECSPFQTIHGENGDTCMIIGKMLAKKMLGLDSLNIAFCSELMDKLVFGNTSIKSAFDIALHDIGAQTAGVPLYHFLGGQQKAMYTDYTVSIGAPEKMAADAEKIVAAGFTVLKVKLGGSAEEDLRRIELIRNKIGMKIPIRIDANQGWTLSTAIDILNKLIPYNIQHCEEPISRKAYFSLPELRLKSKIPIMADESCLDDYDARKLIAIKACDNINIKLGKSSGIFKAKKIIQLAEQAGMKLQAGGFLESRLGFTAMAHVAASSKFFEFYDFDTPLMFKEDVIEGGIEYGKNGLIKLPEAVGLGATLAANTLSKYEKVEVKM